MRRGKRIIKNKKKKMIITTIERKTETVITNSQISLKFFVYYDVDLALAFY